MYLFVFCSGADLGSGTFLTGDQGCEKNPDPG
jgi:hypothetical protein